MNGPAAQIPAEKSALQQSPQEGATCGVQKRRALVVEEDAAARRMVADMLAELGFEVIEAESDLAAVACIARHGAADLLLLDVKLPDMSGVELHHLLKKDLPHLRVIYMAAAATDVPDAAPALQKPVTRDALKAAVAATCADLLAHQASPDDTRETAVVQ